MIPIRTHLQGIGPHESLTINWSEPNSPIAVCASYGTGKTWAVEAVPAALFGRFAWYAGSIYEALTQGGTGEGSIRMIFEHGVETYEVVREIRDTGKTRTQKATLSREVIVPESDGGEDTTWEQIAGPKVGDVDARVRAIVGDEDTALATWFLSQGRRGDLVGLPGESNLVERRRAVFNSLIGADVLDAIADRLAVRARADTTVASELESQLAGDDDLDGGLKDARQLLSDSQAALIDARGTVTIKESALESQRTQLRDAEGGDDVLTAQVNEYERACADANWRRARGGRLGAEIAELHKRAAGLEEAQGDVERLGELRLLLDDLREQREQFEARRAWEQRRDSLAQAENAAGRLVGELQALPGVNAETRALAGRHKSLQDEWVASRATNLEREEANRKRAAQEREIRQQISQAEGRLQDMRRRRGEQPETPFGEFCAPCPLLKEYASLPGEIDAASAELREHEKALADLPAVEEPIDLSELRAEGVRAGAAAEAVEAAAETVQRIAAAQTDLEQNRGDCQEHALSICDAVDDPSASLRGTEHAIDRLAGASERVKAAEQAKSDAEGKQFEFHQAVAEREAQEKAAEKQKPAADSARATLANRETQRAELRKGVECLGRAVAEARGRVEELVGRVSGHESRIADLERRLGEQASKRERVAGLRDDLAGLADLRMCFGPRGVRQVLIDDAAPALEEIAANLFDRATDGRMCLRISTQTALRDGSAAEDFGILVRDEKGERDALRFSGGEQELVRILFRIAVAIWVGQLRGARPDCLFLDEAFDKLGSEGAEDLLRVLEYLGDQFALIVVVTHDPLIADRMPGQIRMVKEFGGVRVVEGGSAA